MSNQPMLARSLAPVDRESPMQRELAYVTAAPSESDASTADEVTTIDEALLIAMLDE